MRQSARGSPGRRAPSSLTGVTALILEPAPPDGVVETVERWAALEYHLNLVVPDAHRTLVPLPAAVPVAGRTAR